MVEKSELVVARKRCEPQRQLGEVDGEWILVDAVEAALRDQTTGFEVVRNGNAVLARTTLGRPSRVLLAGHIDTVPAADNLPSRLDGGEGDMLVGKAIWAHQKKKAHMICELSPYSCMPNTMSIGAMAGVIGKYPEILYAPLEIKGDAEVHALSRCQMILTEAKKRAQREFDETLARTGLTVDDVQAYLHAHPEMRKATYKIPHDGTAAGTAAAAAIAPASWASNAARAGSTMSSSCRCRSRKLVPTRFQCACLPCKCSSIRSTSTFCRFCTKLSGAWNICTS